ncbi:MAG: right-handed parallel beta-helix repeat-containing protein, partial [Armatimonadetes bacterium]|nr:right-handed parallel beta-helix repeat-containing protein [Armatimonadota bacterium]
MKRTWLLILVLISSVVWGKPTTMSANFFIATKGNDSWSGKLAAPNRKKTDGPFATLGRARDELRKLKKEGKLPPSGVTVEVGKGLYEFARPLEFSSEDSGSEIAPIVYRAQPGAQVRLVGGKVVTGWKPVTDPAALGRLDESARGKVMQADLRTLGITSYGQVGGGFGLSGGPGMELFFDDKPMTMARWPNEGFVRIPNVLGETPVDVRGTKGCAEGLFTYEGDRPKRWAAEKDIWVHGYWFWDWADQRHQVEKIDIEKKIITLAKPYHGYGYRKGQWYYAFNVLAELDRPGEYYLDRQAGVLYFWPPEATQADGLRSLNSGKAVVSALPSLITMKDTSYVTLRGFTLEAAQGTAMTITGGENDQIVGCTLRNVGSWALSIGGGKSHSVIGCNITETGDGGISMDGGDRATLTPANHLADNNHIHHYSRWNRMYRPAITINGVGLRVAHNLIHNAPHMAIGFGGNDHIIEFNEIHSVSYESNDAGAIYAGRNWTMRGNVLRHNYLHHINGFEGRGCVGMYLDDMFSSADMYGNVFHKVTMAAFIGGGRDCSIENNIFVDCNPALHIDARAMGWAGYHADDWIKEGREKGTHLGIEFMKPPYSERYPQLLTLLDDDPKAPKGNLIARNVCWGGKWDTSIEAKARPLLKMEDNLVDEDPHFVDLANRNFQLKDDSPAYKLGFKRIPIEQIGLYKDDRRASWPVLHKVREMETPPVARKTGPPPVFKVVKAATAPQIDGVLKADEWSGADPKKAMPIKQGLSGEEAIPTSQAWLTYDEANLYIAIDNTVSKTPPLKKGSTWGQDDAVEIAIRNPAIKTSPIIVLRGYPNNHFESSNESGISDALAKKAGEGVKYSAKIMDATRWIAEMQIPFASLGIDPGKQAKLAFNLTVRKTAESLW